MPRDTIVEPMMSDELESIPSPLGADEHAGRRMEPTAATRSKLIFMAAIFMGAERVQRACPQTERMSMRSRSHGKARGLVILRWALYVRACGRTAAVDVDRPRGGVRPARPTATETRDASRPTTKNETGSAGFLVGGLGE